jgi:hypothetical protein
VIIGQDNSNIPNVVKLFADAFAKSSIEINSLVGQRMVLILRHVQVSFTFSFFRNKFNIDAFFHLDNPNDISNMYDCFNQ